MPKLFRGSLSALLLGVALASHALPRQLPLPPRHPGAATGSALRAQWAPLTATEREEQIFLEVARGNVPNFLRGLAPISLEGEIAGQRHVVRFAVTPDYLAVGSDEDFFRIPMTPALAQQLCDRLGCMLPTRRMVDAIWDQAEAKLVPQPIPPSPDMVTVETFYRHHLMIEEQRLARGVPLGMLVSGVKKDIVLTPQLPLRPPPPRVAIYGWHYPWGMPIQPLSLVHKAHYADYSHGVRLVAAEGEWDGKPCRLEEVLRDPQRALLLSDEGPFLSPARYPAPPAPFFWTVDPEFARP